MGGLLIMSGGYTLLFATIAGLALGSGLAALALILGGIALIILRRAD